MQRLILPIVLGLGFLGCEGKQSEPATGKPNTAAPDPTPEAKAEANGDAHTCVYGDDSGHQEGCPQGPATGAGHFGAPFQLSRARPMASVLESLTAEDAGSVQVSGTVAAVCKRKGCWMVMKDGEYNARVLMKDHGFAVPTDVEEKRAVIEGTVEKRTFDEGVVKHLEEDRGGDPSKVSGSRTEFVLVATGVRIDS